MKVWMVPKEWVWPLVGKEGIRHYEIRPTGERGVLAVPKDRIARVDSVAGVTDGSYVILADDDGVWPWH